MTQNGQGGAPQPGAPWGPDPASGYPAYPAQEPGAPAYGYPQAYPEPQSTPGHVVGPGYEGPGDPHGYGYPPLPEAVTQFIPPVPAAPAAPAHEEAATQFIPPVPAAAGFDGLFRGDDSGHTQHLPPVQEPVLPQPPPRPRPPRAQGPVAPHPQQQYQQQPFQQPHPQQPFQQPHPQQQFAPAPPPPPRPEGQRRVSPGIIAAVVIGLAVVGLGVGSLLGDPKPQNNDPGAVAPAATAGGTAPAGEAPVDSGRPQAVQLDKLLADSNDSRASVIKAVEDVKSCQNLGQAASDLRDAARQREELVTRLQELKVDQLPDHAKLTAALTQAWQASANADNSYAAWADDVNNDKCKDGKAKNSDNAAAGNKASGDATKAKERAATLWNAIAGKYSLTKRDKSQL